MTRPSTVRQINATFALNDIQRKLLELSESEWRYAELLRPAIEAVDKAANEIVHRMARGEEDPP